MNNGMPNFKQEQEFLACIMRSINLDSIAKEHKQYLIENPKELTTILQTAFLPQPKFFVAEWQNFYQKYFNLQVDLSQVKIPAPQTGFDRVIIIPQNLTIIETFKVLRQKMPNVKVFGDSSGGLVDEDVPTNDRDPKNGSYAIRLRDGLEPDKELEGLSADDLAEKQIQGITLLERLIFELKYCAEKNYGWLDTKGATFCSGSRNEDGEVPVVAWQSIGGMSLLIREQNSNHRQRACGRAVVSC